MPDRVVPIDVYRSTSDVNCVLNLNSVTTELRVRSHARLLAQLPRRRATMRGAGRAIHELNE